MDQQISMNDFKTHLQNELTRRCRTNPRYSLRAFAKFLQIDASSVSQIMSGKRNASNEMISRICDKIGWPGQVSASSHSQNYYLLSQDAFAAISDWYHYAILDLTLLKSFKSDVNWIARKLGISKTEAQMAIERLKRLGMLVEKNKRLHKGQSHYANYTEGQTSEAHKEYQRQIITKALLSVDQCPAEMKDITCITIAANTKKLQEAKARIKKFRRELCAFLEDGEGESVHLLAVQLFPLTQIEN